MKLITLFIIIACLHVSAASFAQRVTLSEKNAPLSEVFDKIQKQSGYQFFYKGNLLQDTKVSVNVKDVTVPDAMDAALKNLPITYTITNNIIVIKEREVAPKPVEKANDPPSPPVTITGKVTDSLGTPLINATVAFKGTTKATITDDKGEFTITANIGDVLTISYIGYKTKEVKIITAGLNLFIQLSQENGRLKEVVVSNGYQTLSAEKATGAYDHIDNQMLNRSVGSNVLQRLQGIATGLQGTGLSDAINQTGTDPNLRSIGYTIRGIATVSVNTSPLIVLDNFPYEGDLNNINPNDIESVTILKDAAAASIWGAHAGNGVIVLTSKHGNLNHPITVDFNATTTISDKPNLFEQPGFLSSNDYINTEEYLFKKGYYDGALSNTYNYPAYTPIVGILAQQRAGQISQAQANNQIDTYRHLDIRNDEEKYFYHGALNQQYSLGLNGGGNNMSYYISFGWDKNKGNSGDEFDRKTIKANLNFQPIKKLYINTSIGYTLDNSIPSPLSTVSLPSAPYEMLANAHGGALPTTYQYSTPFIDSLKKLGFLDWNYYPLNEYRDRSRNFGNHNLNLSVNARYKITNYLDINAVYQNNYQNINGTDYTSPQAYSVINALNTFSQYNPSTGAITSLYPHGGTYVINNTLSYQNNYRIQANLNKSIGQHGMLNGLLGMEIEQLKTNGSTNTYDGYNPQFGTFNNNLDFVNYYPINPSGYGIIGYPDAGISGTEYRYLSYFGNLGYSYQDKYSISLTGRKDGSNLFGVNPNDKFNLLWSVGAGWNIDKEDFYQLNWLPNLKFRATYGFNGNIYNAPGYSVGYSGVVYLTGAQAISRLTAPNPNLSWEKVRNINIAIDFQSKNNILYGSIDLYHKDGLRLVEPVNQAPSSGFATYLGNAGNTKGKGLELSLNSDILKGKFKWTSSLIASFNKDILTEYNYPNTSGLAGSKLVGYPLYSVFAYKWAGLDPVNGNPRGYLNGKVSENYGSIINNYKPDSLVYIGSGTPTSYGSWINNFSYKELTLSFRIAYEMGWYFRKPSSSGNIADLLSGYGYDYSQAWQKPGDEQHTNVPSYIYPGDPQRAQFYQNSQINVLNGNNIRLKDIRIEYDLSELVKRCGLSRLNIFCYSSNFGGSAILWRANKFNIDPDASTSIPSPFTIAFGLQATLK